MIKSELLAAEHAVFKRLFEHWDDFEKESLPVVLGNILQEIETEQYLARMQNFADCLKRD